MTRAIGSRVALAVGSVALIGVLLWVIFAINPAQTISPDVVALYALEGDFRRYFAHGLLWAFVMLAVVAGALVRPRRLAPVATAQLAALLVALIACSSFVPALTVDFGLTLAAYDAGLPPVEAPAFSWLRAIQLAGVAVAVGVGVAALLREARSNCDSQQQSRMHGRPDSGVLNKTS